MNLRLSIAPHIRSGETTSRLMLNVIIALVPCAIAGIYNFGVNALVVLAVSMVTAVAAEYLFQVIARRPVRVGDLSALVTGLILGLNLPPTAPWWMAMVGSAFAIIIVKELFGGIGSNFMNPALTARAVLLASWPVFMTTFVNPTYWAEGVDAVTTATPLATGGVAPLDLLLGRIPGSIGEVSKIMILVGLAYLLITRTISWRIPVIMVATTGLLSWAFGSDPLAAVLSGGLLFGAVFMATDYTTSPMTAKGQAVYAVGCGLIVAVIRAFGNYPEGVTYGILVMNVATPLIDKFIRNRVYGHRKEEKAHA
ncbi:MAG TPA: RnfABCDGE type electron transport complex subunit D [Candidatus Excrementavichristensenella intestinipullorum]|nr:RnfABCDGE type electron transport complex subunit D [Candidatus Excrementavichristensenella intestinipullorum]